MEAESLLAPKLQGKPKPKYTSEPRWARQGGALPKRSLLSWFSFRSPSQPQDPLYHNKRACSQLEWYYSLVIVYMNLRLST